MSDTHGSLKEPQSYDAEMLADVRGALDEVSKTPETPAETVTEKPTEPVKEAPVEPRADHPTDSARYADGTYKPTKTATEKPVEARAPELGKPAPEVKPAEAPKVEQQQAAPSGNPPPGWSVKSKATWDALPEHIRADIIKREQEVSSGFAQYSGMKELLPYVERARSRGQTLKQALDRYTEIEGVLERQPLAGLLNIASNIGFTPQRLAMELAPYLGQSNGQGAYVQDQQSYQQPAFDPALLQQYVNPLSQEVNQLKSFVQQFQQAESARYGSAFNAAQSRFMSEPDSRYFENVRQQMAQLFEAGILQESGDHYADLKAAYEMACNMNPEIRELRINERIAKTEEQRRKTEQEATEKARHASRSITGSPAAGAKIDPDDKDDSVEADVRRAVRAHAA